MNFKMSILLSIAIICFSVAQPFLLHAQTNQPKWFIVDDSGESVILVDFANIFVQNREIMAYMMSYKKSGVYTDNKNAKFWIDLNSYDCSGFKKGLVMSTLFRNNGSVIESISQTHTNYSYTTPGSIGSYIFNAVCKIDDGLWGPTKNELNVSQHENALENENGEAALSNGSLSVFNGRLYKVVNKQWLEIADIAGAIEAYIEPDGLVAFGKQTNHMIELRNKKWHYIVGDHEVPASDVPNSSNAIAFLAAKSYENVMGKFIIIREPKEEIGDGQTVFINETGQIATQVKDRLIYGIALSSIDDIKNEILSISMNDPSSTNSAKTAVDAAAQRAVDATASDMTEVITKARQPKTSRNRQNGKRR